MAIIHDEYFECIECETVMKGSSIALQGENEDEICPVCGEVNSFKAVRMFITDKEE